MTEQIPGELIYEYTIQSTGATSYGVPRWTLCCPASKPSLRKGPGTTSPSRGRSPASGSEGTVELTDYIHIRPDGRAQLHIHAEITTEDGKKIGLYADGGAHFTDGPPVGDLRENVTMTTSEPDYAWVNALQIWAWGTVDLAKGEAHVTGYVV